MFRVNHHAYCGMAGIPACFDTAAEARDYATAKLHHFRRSFSVITLTPGRSWEILEPDDCVLVPDACGTLDLDHIIWKCRECGNPCETQADALHCCAFDDN